MYFQVNLHTTHTQRHAISKANVTPKRQLEMHTISSMVSIQTSYARKTQTFSIAQLSTARGRTRLKTNKQNQMHLQITQFQLKKKMFITVTGELKLHF